MDWETFNAFNIKLCCSGADPGILVGGGGAGIFFKGRGSGAALRSQVGPGHRRGGGPGGEAPGSSWILVTLGVKFNHIVSSHRWSYTLSEKKKCTLTSEIFFQSNLFVYHWAVIWISWIWTPTIHTAVFITCYAPCLNRCFLFSFTKI